MILTAEQKPVFRHIYLLSLAGITLVFILGKIIPELGTTGEAPLLASKLAEKLFFMFCWGWDWFMRKDRQKFLLLLPAALGHWVLIDYLKMDDSFYKSFQQSGRGIQDLVRVTGLFLFSSMVWLGVARGIAEGGQRSTVLTGLVSGAIVTIAMSAVTNGWINLARIVMYAGELAQLAVRDYSLNNWWYDNMIHWPIYILYACMPVLALWTWFLVKNVLTDRLFSLRQLLVNGFYKRIGGLHFAMLYPLFCLVCVGLTGYLANDLQMIFRERGEEKFALGNLIFIFINGSLLYLFFYMLRSLVISRCIALHRQLDFLYYLCFIPALNLIPFIYYTVARKEADADTELAYAELMNDPGRARHRFTTGFVIFTSVLPLVLLVGSGRANLEDGGNLLAVLVMLLQVILLIGMVYRPRVKYWIIAVQAIAVFLVVYQDGRELDRQVAHAALLQLLTGILALNWYEKIFHPDVFVEADYGFGEDTNTKQEPADN